MSDHLELIKEEFTRQAATFNEYQRGYSKDTFTVGLLAHIDLPKKGRILEVAPAPVRLGAFLRRMPRSWSSSTPPPLCLRSAVPPTKKRGSAMRAM